MIRLVSECPYCGHGVVAVDDDVPKVVIDPDRAGRGPCPHLAYSSIGLGAYAAARSHRLGHPAAHDGLVAERSGIWLWEYGRGLRRLKLRELDRVGDYIDNLACDLMPPEEAPHGHAYRVVGGTAGDREDREPGSGEFRLSECGDTPLVAVFDAWSIYTVNPAMFVRAIEALVWSDGRP